jgi:hypothetical protein
VIYFSAGCFVVGLSVTALVSILRRFSCLKQNVDDDTTIDATKTVDESDLNKNLLTNKA